MAITEDPPRGRRRALAPYDLPSRSATSPASTRGRHRQPPEPPPSARPTPPEATITPPRPPAPGAPIRRAVAVGALVLAISGTAIVGSQTDQAAAGTGPVEGGGVQSAVQGAVDHAAQVLDPFRRAADARATSSGAGPNSAGPNTTGPALLGPHRP